MLERIHDTQSVMPGHRVARKHSGVEIFDRHRVGFPCHAAHSHTRRGDAIASHYGAPLLKLAREGTSLAVALLNFGLLASLAERVIRQVGELVTQLLCLRPARPT